MRGQAPQGDFPVGNKSKRDERARLSFRASARLANPGTGTWQSLCSEPTGRRPRLEPGALVAKFELAVAMILASAFPMALRWGPDFVLIYNDAYGPILGDKHPWALGRPAGEAWAEVWEQIAPAHHGHPQRESALDLCRRHAAAHPAARDALGRRPFHPRLQPYRGSHRAERHRRHPGHRRRDHRTGGRPGGAAHSEERYELALGAAGAIGTWDWDIVNDRVIANAKFAELYSVDPARAAAGAPIAELRRGHPSRRPRARRRRDQRSIENRTDFASEYRLLQRDGSMVWVFARGRAHYDADGKPHPAAGRHGRHHRPQTHRTGAEREPQLSRRHSALLGRGLLRRRSGRRHDPLQPGLPGLTGLCQRGGRHRPQAA